MTTVSDDRAREHPAAIFDTTMIVTGLLIMAGAYLGRQALGPTA
jgi:hypothetical protein